MTCIYAIADRLSYEVIGNGIAGQTVGLEEFPLFLDIVRLIEGLLDIKVIAPAGEFEAVIAHFFSLRGKFGKREIRPLAGE